MFFVEFRLPNAKLTLQTCIRNNYLMKNLPVGFVLAEELSEGVSQNGLISLLGNGTLAHIEQFCEINHERRVDCLHFGFLIFFAVN